MLTISDFPCSKTTSDTILRQSRQIIDEDVHLAFESDIVWDVEALSSDFANWMSNEAATPTTTSRAGILSSGTFERLVQNLVGVHLSSHLRLLVKLSTFLHNYGPRATYAGYSAMDLWSLRSFAGNMVLNRLEAVLRDNKKLARASKQELQALFMMLFGATIAVAYTTSINQIAEVRAPWIEFREHCI